MVETNQCIKEWNATIEALGQGIQTIFIRVYPTKKERFLLYPTWNYLIKDNYLEGFKDSYQSFVEENSNSDGNILIKYYAECKEIMDGTLTKIDALDKHYIWTKNHVKSYINNRKSYIWILRIYQLKEPQIVSPALGQINALLSKKIDITDSKPVLNDRKFNQIVEEIKRV